MFYVLFCACAPCNVVLSQRLGVLGPLGTSAVRDLRGGKVILITLQPLLGHREQ